MNVDELGIDVARRVAQWHLGSHYWADKIIAAYLDPDAALKQLVRDKGACETCDGSGCVHCEPGAA